MYSGSSADESHEDLGKEISQASSMPWVRNLYKYVGSESGLGSEAVMELETRRCLLENFKQRQQKTSNAGTIPSFYKKKPYEGSIASRVQRLAKFRFLKKQSDLLLNADDLVILSNCLQQNCDVDDLTGVEKMNYEEFCHIASVCEEEIGSKSRCFFCPSNFMKFEKDEFGRIDILPFYLYVMRTVTLTEARINMSELDEDVDGFLQTHEMEAYIRCLVRNSTQLRDMDDGFLPMYCRIAARKFFFFCDPHRRGKLCIKKVLLSNCLAELMELDKDNEEDNPDREQGDNCFSLEGANWFSLKTVEKIFEMFMVLDTDKNGTLSKRELREYAGGMITDIFIERVFDMHVRHGKCGGGNPREMDFESFLDFVLALENRVTPEGLTYIFRCLDLNGRGYLTASDICTLFRDLNRIWVAVGNLEILPEDFRVEIWDMVNPSDPLKMTLADLLASKQGHTVASSLIDFHSFWKRELHEYLIEVEEEK